MINNEMQRAIELSFLGSMLDDFEKCYPKLKVKINMLTQEDVKNVFQYIIDKGEYDYLDFKRKAKVDRNFMNADLFDKMLAYEDNDAKMFISYQNDVIDSYRKRTINDALSNYLTDQNKSNFEYVKDTINTIEDVGTNEDGSLTESFEQIIMTVQGELLPKTIKTGFTNLDLMIGGFEPAQLNIIGARPSVGKTAFALNLLLKLAERGNSVKFFSLETTKTPIARRLIGTAGTIQTNKMKSSEFITEREKKAMFETIDKINALDIKVYDNYSSSVSDIRRQLKKNEDKNQIIIIDYIQLMRGERGNYGSRQEEVSDITRTLKSIAKEYDCTIIGLSQLGRGVEGRQDKRPNMSDLRESGAIEQDADMIMFLHRDDYYDRDSSTEDDIKNNISTTELIISKNKEGATGTIQFRYYKQTQIFDESNWG